MEGLTKQNHSLSFGLTSHVMGLQYPYRQNLRDWSLELQNVGQIQKQATSQLEDAVSLTQVAQVTIVQILQRVQDMKQFLSELQFIQKKTLPPESIINHFLEEKLQQIKKLIVKNRFNETPIFSGHFGTHGETLGKHLQLVSFSSNVLPSPAKGYPVVIKQNAQRATLIGSEKLTSENLKLEKMISLFEGGKEIHYSLKKEESPDSLVQNLQNLVALRGLDLGVFRTSDNHLMVIHNQLGSRPNFQGLSYQSRILSETPALICAPQTKGRDIAGSIAGETALGKGGFLFGKKGNLQTDGLVLYYDGSLHYSGEVVGRVLISKNSLETPLPYLNQSFKPLNFPNLFPEKQAIGVGNQSGFLSLADLKGGTQLQRHDALKLIEIGIERLESLKNKLKQQEEQYVEQALHTLRSPLQIPFLLEEAVCSKEKAHQMERQLREMVV